MLGLFSFCRDPDPNIEVPVFYQQGPATIRSPVVAKRKPVQKVLTTSLVVSDPMAKALYLDDSGHLVEVDLHTGEESKLEHHIEEEPGFFDRYKAVPDSNGNLVYVPHGIDSGILKELQGSHYSFPYSPLLAERICGLLVEGKFITNICNMPNMPSYGQLAKWRRFFPEFDTAYRQAIVDRAEYYLASAVREVEATGADRDEISLAKLKGDMYKYVAKVGDPESFTERQSVKAEVAVTGYLIETGIRRPGDPGFNRDETRDITAFEESEDDN